MSDSPNYPLFVYQTLTVQDAIKVLHGDGFKKFVKVISDDGLVAIVEVGDVNPLTMRILA